MAVASRLKTADGKYYATENYVDDKISASINTEELVNKVLDEGGDQIVTEVKDEVMTEVNSKTDALSQTLEETTESLNQAIEDKASKETVYTKEEVDEIVNNFYSFNTL